MNLGNSLYHARKKCGYSQETVAEKLGVSRQTVSKWETDETIPDIRQSKKMAVLYKMSLDELIDFDVDIKEIQDIIEKSNEATEEKIDWTKAWGSKPKKVKQLLIILAVSLMKASFFNMYGSVINMYLPITSPCSHPQKYVRNITSVFIFNPLPVIYLSDAYDFSRFVPKYLSEPA